MIPEGQNIYNSVNDNTMEYDEETKKSGARPSYVLGAISES